MKTSTPPCVIGQYCRLHNFIHGAEAEELRERLGRLNSQKVNAILEDVDARDSDAYLICQNRAEERIKVLELEIAHKDEAIRKLQDELERLFEDENV